MMVNVLMSNYFRILFLTALIGFGYATTLMSSPVNVAKEIKGFLFSDLNEIPIGPFPDIKQTSCEAFTITEQDQKFTLSSHIREKGWLVLAEIQLAPYRLVSFAGQFDPGPSFTCSISQGSIAIFDNEKLLGLISAEDADSNIIGGLKLMDAGYVRLFSGSYLQELVAELHLNTEGLELKHISAYTSYCNGRAILPNTLGEDIEIGRELLFKFGFKPIVNEQILTSWEAQYYEGINEIVGCSNRIPWCLFEYENDYSRVVLSTLGNKEIIRDEVYCK